MNRNLLIALIVIGNLAVDQLSKIWVRANFIYGETKELIGDKFVMQYVENKGAFLGMGSDMNPTLHFILLKLLPLLVLLYVVYYIVKTKSLDKLSLIAFSCIVGGGLANVIDRFLFSSVTDFFFIDLGGVFKTGIFNVADVAVTTGMFMLIFSNFILKKKKSEA
ncbi:signal peptidase II [Winogradskyella wandonensis]|uniref:Lipoprotein signal peptidase n=1 Tax=Winogradskyella wandonensis TaxID=1442586 RepID=A0A4R1KR04_9FLAO|nr:signal peptidase II [Winogradskyella wandonensis]TCK67495.1 signal peptidase II [Winogradskyella wandonensis]